MKKFIVIALLFMISATFIGDDQVVRTIQVNSASPGEDIWPYDYDVRTEMAESTIYIKMMTKCTEPRKLRLHRRALGLDGLLLIPMTPWFDGQSISISPDDNNKIWWSGWWQPFEWPWWECVMTLDDGNKVTTDTVVFKVCPTGSLE